MEIIGTNIYEKEQKNKKIMKIIIIILIVLLIVSLGLGIYIAYLKAEQFKFDVDGIRLSNNSIPNDLFKYNEDKLYISLRDIAPIIGYKYNNGGYKQYTEDINKCYLESNYEVCTFENNSKKIYKTPSTIIDYEYFTIEDEITMIDNKLYISPEGLMKACNIIFYYDQEKNHVIINTLSYLVASYTITYKDSALNTSFNNQKALLDGFMVVQNYDNTITDNVNRNNIRYGINDLQNNEIVGMKYTKIEYIESNKEFIVTTPENKVGIISADGTTKVSPQYDSLKQIDKDLNLYLVVNNNKKGVIEKNGKILIYLEYDEIGINMNDFPTNDIKNQYLLFNNAIPVKQNGKWGLFNIRGEQILPIEYKSIGCITKNSAYNSVVVIPDVNAIVVEKEYEIEKNRKVSYYGIVDLYGRILIQPNLLDTVYSVTSNGRDEYSMVNNGTTYNVIEYINKWSKVED